MTYTEFQGLPYAQKLAAVGANGTFLAVRPCTGHYAALYYMPGNYFVECFYHAASNQFICLHGVLPAYGYAHYLEQIKLPAELLR